MKQHEIIEMAREAGINVEQGFLLRFMGVEDDLKTFAKLVMEREREECAKVVESFQRDHIYTADLAGHVAAIKHKLADAIRARGKAQ